MAGEINERTKDGASGVGEYLSSAASYIPSLGRAADTAKEAPGQAQKGVGIAGGKVKDLTAPVPVVGSVIEGAGNAPIAQKLGGKEEEKGYLGTVYEYAGGAVRTVYDAAGNVVGTISHTAGSYIHGSEKEGSAPEEHPHDTVNQRVMQKAQEAAEKEDRAINSVKPKISNTSATAQDSATKAAHTYNDTTAVVKDGTRDVEDSEVGSSVGDMAKGATGEEKIQEMGHGAKDAGGAVTGGASDTAGGIAEGGKSAVTGVADTGKDAAKGVGAGVSSAGSALGGMMGLSGGKKG